MDKQSPRVSVVMSVYNGEKYLREAVDSIINQTFTDFEFIIIDDGSTDQTAEILNCYTDPRIVRLKNEINIGLAASLNKGIGIARGEYIARMDADDISLPDRLGLQTNFMSENRKIGALGTRIEIIDEGGERMNGMDWHRYIARDPEIMNWHLFFESPIMHPSAIIQKSLFIKAGGYFEDEEPAEDYGLWIRMAKITSLANLNEVLVLYRWHSTKVSVLRHEKQKITFSKINHKVISNYFAHFSSSKFDYSNSLSPDDTEYTYQKAKTVLALYRLFVNHNHLTAKQKKMIRKDMARRLFSIAKQDKRDRRLLQYLLYACWLDMANFKQIVNILVVKLLRNSM